MNYNEAYEYMESRMRGDGAVQPDQVLALWKRFDDPRTKIKYVHAAGIKDATAAFVASILRCAGFKVGSFLPIPGAEWGEQILVGRRRINRKAFGEGVAFVRETGDRMAAEGCKQPTAEYAESLLAMWYFAGEGCQVAVMENAIVMWEPQELLADGDAKFTFWEEEPDCGEAMHIRRDLRGQTFDYKTYQKLEIPLVGIEQIEVHAAF